MATLTGTAPKDTYKDLLRIPNSNAGADGTLRQCQDGNGSNLPLYMSTSAIKPVSLYTNVVVPADVGGFYELTESDSGKTLKFTSATDVYVTIPNGLTVGWTVKMIQFGAGGIPFFLDSTVVYNRNGHSGPAGQYAVIFLEVVETNKMVLWGDTA